LHVLLPLLSRVVCSDTFACALGPSTHHMLVRLGLPPTICLCAWAVHRGARYDGQRCINLGGDFKPGHGDAFYNNTCIVGLGGGLRKPSGCGDPSCFPMCAGLDPFKSECGLSHSPPAPLDKVGGIGNCDPSIIKASTAIFLCFVFCLFGSFVCFACVNV
jgi:hypothetical protein